MKILVVDDESDMTEMVGYTLRNHGYEVATAANATEALNQARLLLPDAIFMDLMLPDLDGTSVCEILQSCPSTKYIPVIMLTACATDAAKLICLHAGAADFITKPFSPRELVARLRDVLTMRKAGVEVE